MFGNFDRRSGASKIQEYIGVLWGLYWDNVKESRNYYFVSWGSIGVAMG